MCLALPGKVLEIVDAQVRIGRADVFGARRLINLGMLDDVQPGDWVLIQMGLAIEKIDEAQAQETRRFFEELGAAFEHELVSATEESEP